MIDQIIAFLSFLGALVLNDALISLFASLGATNFTNLLINLRNNSELWMVGLIVFFLALFLLYKLLFSKKI